MKNKNIKAKVIPLTKDDAEPMKERISKMGHPTLYELSDKTKTVFDLIWLRDLGANFRIERK